MVIEKKRENSAFVCVSSNIIIQREKNEVMEKQE